ncbi:MAG: protein translocase subunit SecD [Gracilibacteraceae bacterium]|jgi:SecD/SecF fusion protein|nr:protein translocase subunit SecD [Gracilibacteraceae bacterium]
MNRRNGVKLFVTVVLLAVAAGLSVAPLTSAENGIPLGLDLRGGVHLALQAVPDEGSEVTDENLDDSRAVIERRINELGVSEPHLEIDYVKDRLIVEIAGVDNPDDAVEILRTTAKLTFRNDAGEILMDGSHLTRADGRLDQDYAGAAVIEFSLDSEGTEIFAELTRTMVNQHLGVYLDEELLTNPTIQEPITGGSGRITGYASLEEAMEHAILLRSGALPVSFNIVERRQVGALLGSDSLARSLQACAVAVGLIFIFVIILYRLPGLVASFAILAFSLIVLWLLKGIGAVLTLPGIAGFVLSIGMAVDLNIIIYERLKEELRMGKSPRAAVDAAFSRAFITVFDSNITTLFAAGTLFVLGTSMIKGFALILGIGILTSLFTAVTFSRMVMRWCVGLNPRIGKKWFGVKERSTPVAPAAEIQPPSKAESRRRAKSEAIVAVEGETYEDVKTARKYYFNIVSRRKTWYIVAAILAVVSLGSLGVRGLNLGIDFTGGTILDITFNAPVPQEGISAVLADQGMAGTVQLSDGDTAALIRLPELTDDSREEFLLALAGVGEFARENVQEDTVGPSIGAELRGSAIRALIVATILMLAYIAFRFRLNYAIAGILTLLQDVLIVAGVFSLFQWQVDSTFIAAVLTVFGYDINDTVVIYDRIRENEKKLKRRDSFEDMVDKSIWQTMGRSVNTTLAMMIALFSILILGGESTRLFAAAMIVGVAYGAYSTIFLSSQLVLELKKLFGEKRAGTA